MKVPCRAVVFDSQFATFSSKSVSADLKLCVVQIDRGHSNGSKLVRTPPWLAGDN
jgi:hypothetical protein